MRICVFEDDRVDQFGPLTLARPMFDLRCGAATLIERQRRFFAAEAETVRVRSHLTNLCKRVYPDRAINAASGVRSTDGLIALVNARWLALGDGPAEVGVSVVGVADGETAYAILPAADAESLAQENLTSLLVERMPGLPHRPAGGRMLAYPWDLIEHNGEALEQDYQYADWERERGPVPAGVIVVGPSERAIINPRVRIEPLAVIDTTRGPVLIDEDAVVQAFSRLEGPCHVGPGTQVLGAKVRGGSLGPQCRIGGEVEASIVHGHSNKAHDGFLGHAYVGEWVNLGAGTQNSDLRNDYAPVRVRIQGQRVNTGLRKVGAFIGDHTKTSLNTLLNTGAVVGPFAQLLASGALLPSSLPAFSQFSQGAIQERTALRELFSTAATVMARRGQEWTETHAALFLEVYEQTAAERQKAVHDAEVRRLRRVG